MSYPDPQLDPPCPECTELRADLARVTGERDEAREKLATLTAKARALVEGKADGQ